MARKDYDWKQRLRGFKNESNKNREKVQIILSWQDYCQQCCTTSPINCCIVYCTCLCWWPHMPFKSRQRTSQTNRSTCDTSQKFFLFFKPLGSIFRRNVEGWRWNCAGKDTAEGWGRSDGDRVDAWPAPLACDPEHSAGIIFFPGGDWAHNRWLCPLPSIH